MSVIRWILTILMILISIAITVIILMQEGKDKGLGTISGAADTLIEGNSKNSGYWNKIKSRSLEGRLLRITTILCVVFFILTLLLDMNLF